SPDSTRSHFDAQDYMETATPGVKSTSDGWLNRYLQARKAEETTPFRAVALTSQLPRMLQGTAPALAMSQIAQFGIRGGQSGDVGVRARGQRERQPRHRSWPRQRDDGDRRRRPRRSRLRQVAGARGRPALRRARPGGDDRLQGCLR